METIVGASVSLNAAYKWRHDAIIHASDHGTVDIDIQGVQIAFDVEVGEANGRPTVASKHCTFSLQHMQFTFHGKVAWIYNDLESAFSGEIKSAVTNAVPKAVEHGINVKAEEALAKLQVVVPWKHVLMDLSLVAPPYFASDDSYFSFGLKGEWEDRANPTKCPFSPAKLPYSLNNNMLQIYVGDYVANCAALVYYKQGVLHKVVTPEDLPPKDAYLLNTTTYEYIIPPLYSYYPNANMSVDVWATQAPMSTFDSNGVSLNGEVQVNVSVIVVNGTKHIVPAFSLLGDVTMLLQVNIANLTVYAKLNKMSCNFTLLYSNIGTFTFTVLELFLQEACANAIPEVFNAYFSNVGLPIPSVDGFSLVNPVISYGAGYVGASSSVKYSPPLH